MNNLVDCELADVTRLQTCFDNSEQDGVKGGTPVADHRTQTIKIDLAENGHMVIHIELHKKLSKAKKRIECNVRDRAIKEV